jgi:hypothetical protein
MWDSESKEPIDRKPDTLALDLPFFDDYFGCLQFKYEREISLQEDEWESESQDPINDGPSCLEQEVIYNFN